MNTPTHIPCENGDSLSCLLCTMHRRPVLVMRDMHPLMQTPSLADWCFRRNGLPKSKLAHNLIRIIVMFGHVTVYVGKKNSLRLREKKPRSQYFVSSISVPILVPTIQLNRPIVHHLSYLVICSNVAYYGFNYY